MKYKNLVRSLVFGLGLSLSMLSHAKNYNDGFVAAESGQYDDAISIWKPLAEKGHPIAQFNLALLYHSGQGVKLDENKAVHLYHQAAEKGYHKAQEFLAVGYREGWFGLPIDAKKAEYWQQKLDSAN